MAILSLQFGQCGNQLANSVFSYVHSDLSVNNETNREEIEYIGESQRRWFVENQKDKKLTARSILVDTEQKVLSDLKNETKEFRYKNFVAKGGQGAGNNWAFGYTEKSKEIEDTVIDMCRKETEASDLVPGILAYLSSAGGTGSGVGSKIIENVKDEFPTTPIVSIIVLPCEKGEVATQTYNTLFTLSKLYDCCDMCVIFQNDQLKNMANKLLEIKEYQLNHFNQLIAQKIASLFQPAGDNTVLNVVNHLVGHPNYKLANLKTCPHVSKRSANHEWITKWESLVFHGRQMLRSSTNFDWEIKYASSTNQRQNIEYCTSVSNLVVTRGKGGSNIDLKLLRECDIYPKWVPSQGRLEHYHQNRKLYRTEKLFTLATNNYSLYRPIDSVVEKAWGMYSCDAYVHHYEKFGVDKEQFLEAFGNVETVIEKYKKLGTYTC